MATAAEMKVDIERAINVQAKPAKDRNGDFVNDYGSAYNAGYVGGRRGTWNGKPVARIPLTNVPPPDSTGDSSAGRVFWTDQGIADGMAGRPNRLGYDTSALDTPAGDKGTVYHADGTATSFDNSPLVKVGTPTNKVFTASGGLLGGLFGGGGGVGGMDFMQLLVLSQLFGS